MTGLVLIAAGGTGGHLFPAEALAGALAGRGWRVHLVTDRRAETYGRDFPAEETHFVRSATLTRSPISAASGLIQLARGFFEARRLVRRLAPDVAVGFGGYPTAPPMLAAALAGVPTVIHEQNAVLGRANRFLASRVDRIAVSVPGVGRPTPRRVVTGNPVRAAVREAARIGYPVRHDGDPFRLLAFGGSQGARFLSDVVPEAVARLGKPMLSQLSVKQQCRPEDLGRVTGAYRATGLAADVRPFFADLPRCMADSHLVICRSGASTCAELTVIGRPAIMVPLPGALDQDQKANAEVLARAGGGWMIEQAALTADRLAADIATAMGEPDRLAKAAAAARSLARPDAAERLADVVEQVAARRTDHAHQGVLA